MKLKYEAQRGNRIKTRYFRTVLVDCVPLNLWFSHKDNKLKTIDACKLDKEGYSNTLSVPVRSVKAFRRFVARHHNELTVGGKFILLSRYIGYSVSYTRRK